MIVSSDGQHNINQILNLVELAEDKSPTQRNFLYQKIGNFLIEDSELYSSAEKELMADILCRITNDIEKSVRAELSKNIAKKENMPPELLGFLANDDIEIALPILQDCGVLDEIELVKIVRTRSSQHLLAIAARNNISESVSRALCDSNNEEVCVTLLKNHTARIPDTVLETLSSKSEIIIAYQRPLLQRPFLPIHIAEKMYRWISAALKEYIIHKFDIDPDILELSGNQQTETIQSISQEKDPSEKLVDKLHKAGELSNGFMLKSLRQGEIDLFEHTFAKLLEMTRDQIQKILYSKDPQLLAVACRVLGLDRIVYSTILDLTASVNHVETPLSDEQRENVVGFYGLLKLEAAERALGNQLFIDGEIKYFQTN
ncbi:MAG: DUF2336 domain-containing protein [Sneathiella sp.]|nr:DUF2336 domain-containing protein [Sneathiella sp.]